MLQENIIGLHKSSPWTLDFYSVGLPRLWIQFPFLWTKILFMTNSITWFNRFTGIHY